MDDETRQCSRCGETKPLTDDHFPRKGGTKRGIYFRGVCRPCHAAIRALRSATPEARSKVRERASGKREEINRYAREWRNQNKEHLSEYRRQHHQAHRDEINAERRAQRAADPDKFRQKDHERYERDHARICERRKKSRQERPRIVSEKTLAWRAANQARLNEKERERRSTSHGKALAVSYKKTNRVKINRQARMWQSSLPAELRSSRWKAHAHRRRALKKGNGGTFTTEQYQSVLAAQDWRCYYCLEDISLSNHADHYVPLSSGGSNSIDNIVAACERCNTAKRAAMPAAFISSLAVVASAPHFQSSVLRCVQGLGVPAQSSEGQILIRDRSIAIEINDLYGHSSVPGGPMDDRYALQERRRQLSDEGWRVVFLWEDDWVHRRAACESYLRALLRPDLLPLSNARDCDIVKLSNVDAAAFLDDVHIQGRAFHGDWYGLVNGSLHAVMGMARTRAVFDHSERVELLRYASVGRVRGGASRLLKRFVDEGATEIVSFSDNDYFEGGMYEAIGFRHDGDNQPDYMPVWSGRRRHKSFTQRRRLAEMAGRGLIVFNEETMTEAECLRTNNIRRCWNSGRRRWLLTSR
jgi:hypothetical protein